MRAGMPDDPDTWEPDEDDVRAMRDAPENDDHGFEPSPDDFRHMEAQRDQDQRVRATLHLTRTRATTRAVVIARCPVRNDGRILFGVYPFEGRLWLWREGLRWDTDGLEPERRQDGSPPDAVDLFRQLDPAVDEFLWATCPGCRVDYTPGNLAEVAGAVRRALDSKRSGALRLTRVEDIHVSST